MNRTYALPGYTAIALAVLFPIYWVSTLGLGEQSLLDAFIADLNRVSARDALFVLIGVMEIYIYLALRKVLLEHLHGGVPAIMLLLMAIVVGLFHATVLFDVVLAFTPDLAESTREALGTTSAVIAISGLFVYTVLASILSIVLLVGKIELPPLLKVFAVLLLACCLLQFTVVLGVVNIFLFPVVLLVLAVFFLRGGHEVEVV
ncbi:hypothetical protein [Wenzhouxiangella sp. XN24]|uniref:hypothetical protein n=1 Tax=Wenzhouxiangella sp. XN24 TaxID=2713569 RepID=UPI0013EA8A19|nr:hypothetical protein [Wenzhouxiangella sp. XN24]NGX17190.1 hypothetical protein [Wenzhouxiangella sp. XN24]